MTTVMLVALAPLLMGAAVALSLRYDPPRLGLDRPAVQASLAGVVCVAIYLVVDVT